MIMKKGWCAVIVFTLLLAVTAAFPQSTGPGSDYKAMDNVQQYLVEAKLNNAAPSEEQYYEEDSLEKAAPGDLPEEQDYEEDSSEKALAAAPNQLSEDPGLPDYQETAFEEGWGFRHISSLNMASHHQQCPANLMLKRTGSLRLCGKKNYGGGCDSVVIRTHGQNYRIVCGRVKGYQYASTDGFHRFNGADNNIDAPYVDGVSVTYGMHPRKHIWTYAVGLIQHPHHGGLIKSVSCPRVGGTRPPAFVGNNYFCSSGNPTQTWHHTLYDRKPLWSYPSDTFCVTLPETIKDDLELRICTDQASHDENILIESFDFYVK